MEFQNDWVFQILQGYAYSPVLVYVMVFVLMIASGFGLPIPEEVTIISVGILAYMGRHPELFPPPEIGMQPIDGYTIAAVTTFAILLADNVVFLLGRHFGRKIIAIPRFKSIFGDKVMGRINYLTAKYGMLATFIFRFTPGIRFPAHVALGMSDTKHWKFALIDGMAALISVPTQILLVYHYGESILSALKQFKIVFFSGLLIFLIIYFLKKWRRTSRSGL